MALENINPEVWQKHKPRALDQKLHQLCLQNHLLLQCHQQRKCHLKSPNLFNIPLRVWRKQDPHTTVDVEPDVDEEEVVVVVTSTTTAPDPDRRVRGWTLKDNGPRVAEGNHRNLHHIQETLALIPSSVYNKQPGMLVPNKMQRDQPLMVW